MSQRRALSTLGIVLVISLIANALLIGMTLGNSVGGRGEPPRDRGPRGGGDDVQIARAIESVVPEDVRKEVRQGFRAAFREAMPYMNAKREAQRGLLDALGAQPFDREALDAAFAEVRETDLALTASFQSVLADELAGLTDEQRADVVKWLNDLEEARRERWKQRRQDRGDRPGPRDGPPPGDGPPPPPLD